jgi:hypothetical protein
VCLGAHTRGFKKSPFESKREILFQSRDAKSDEVSLSGFGGWGVLGGGKVGEVWGGVFSAGSEYPDNPAASEVWRINMKIKLILNLFLCIYLVSRLVSKL